MVMAALVACGSEPPSLKVDIEVKHTVEVKPGEFVDLVANVTGGQSELTYKWSATDGQLPADMNRPSVRVVAPLTPGNVTVALEVIDTKGQKVAIVKKSFTVVEETGATVVQQAAAATPTPAPSPTALPTQTPIPTATPTQEPTATPTQEPTATATLKPTSIPSPTAIPATPTIVPPPLECKGTTSAELNQQAYKAWNENNFEQALACVNEVIQRWSGKADEQQAARQKDNACLSTPDPKNKEQMDSYWTANWAVNDVATSWWIRGEILKQQGNITAAKKSYKTVIDTYSCAFAWEQQGWFWRVADAAQGEYDKIK